MKRLIPIVVLMSALAFGQAARYDQPAQTVTSLGGVSLLAPSPLASITVCNYPATGGVASGSGGHCTNKAAVCPDMTATGCTTGAPNNPATADSLGNFGFWIAPGIYQYTICPQSGVCTGPYNAWLPFGFTSPSGILWPQPMEFKTGPLYDVRAYGAKVDGVTDDTVADQAALTAATANGGVFYVPATGHTSRACGLTVAGSGGWTIKGDGPYSNSFGHGSVLECNKPNQNALTITNGSNIAIENIGLIGGSGTGKGLEIDASVNTIRGVHLTNVIASNSGSHGFYFHGGSGSGGFLFQMTMNGLEATNNGGDGFNLFGRISESTLVGTYSDANGGNCYTFDGGNGGVAHVGEAVSLTLINTTSGSCAVAFKFKDARGVSAYGSYYENPTTAALQLYGCRYCVFIGGSAIVGGTAKNIEFAAGGADVPVNDHDYIDVPGWISTSTQTMLTYTSGTIQDVRLGSYSSGSFSPSNVTGTPFYANGKGFIFRDWVGQTGLTLPGATSGTTLVQPAAVASGTLTLPTATGTLADVIASGTSTFTTTAVGSGACQTTVTTAATNALTTDTIAWAYATAPTAATDGMLTIQPYVTAGNVNFMRCNPTAGSITPTALVINWRVVR